MSDIEDTPMLCYQCEQTVHPHGCSRVGVCSKTPTIAYKQDLIIAGLKSLSLYTADAKAKGCEIPEQIYDLTIFYLFMTLTNTNFDEPQHDEALKVITDSIAQVKKLVSEKTGKEPVIDNMYASWTSTWPKDKVSLTQRQKRQGATVTGLLEMIIYGLKGLAAYAYHAIHLRHSPTAVLAQVPDLIAFAAQAEDALADEAKKGTAPSVDAILAQLLHLGELCHLTMESLDGANTGAYGDPVPTEVVWGPVEGKCILVSGHDLADLYQLLQQTEGKGINIFTHGEMLAAHAYPLLHAFPHFKGHFGVAWQNQKTDFAAFPGPILMTTNCITPPAKAYADRIWTTGPVGFPSVQKVVADDSKPFANPPPQLPLAPTDFAPIIEQALALPGFTAEDVRKAAEHAEHAEEAALPAPPAALAYPRSALVQRSITVGFARRTLASVADAVLQAVGEKKLTHVFVVGGCDGSEKPRSYYTDLCRLLPPSTAVLTAACGKFRINWLGLDKQRVPGTAIPRLLDAGQCNDVFSLVSFASLLAAKAGCTPNELPLSIVLSWFEQKAVADLLALLFLGIKNVRVGPRPPLFITPEALDILNKKFGLALTTTPEADLKAMMPQ